MHNVTTFQTDNYLSVFLFYYVIISIGDEMGKRVCARAIIFDNDNIVLMFRRRKKEDGKYMEYYSLPGGGQEANETLYDTAIREVYEEFNLKVIVRGYVGMVEDDKTIQHFYHCEKLSGDIKLNGEEKDRNCKENYYEPLEIPIDRIPHINLMFQDMIEKAFQNEYLDN